MTHLTAHGIPARWAVVDDKQAICRSDDQTGAVMGIFAPGYTRYGFTHRLHLARTLVQAKRCVGSGGYWRDMATRSRSSGVIRWSASSASSPRSIWTQLTVPVKMLVSPA